MKKQIATFTLLLLTLVTFGQYNDYDRGFKNGFKAGYCYNDYSCIAPVTPITPIPLIGESNDNYQDGYNRGFKRGLEDKQAKKNSDNYNSQGNSTKQPYVSSYVSPNYNALLNILEARKAQYEQNEQLKKEKAMAMMSQVKAYYNSLATFPETIPDGWHKVISTNNYDFCEERKVYVSNNKVTKYVIDDWYEKTVSYPTAINRAKSMAQLKETDGTNGDLVELYFLEFINNPNSYTSPPVGSGKISFWSNMKRSGTISIYVEGEYIGDLTSYFSEGSPRCEQSGTVVYENKPGTYSFKATSTNGSWSGTIKISSGGCGLQGLLK